VTQGEADESCFFGRLYQNFLSYGGLFFSGFVREGEEITSGKKNVAHKAGKKKKATNGGGNLKLSKCCKECMEVARYVGGEEPPPERCKGGKGEPISQGTIWEQRKK